MTRAAFDPTTLIRASVADLKPYTPIVPFEVLSQQLNRPPEEIIKLDANENPHGPSPRVAAALAQAPYMHIYPDPESRALRRKLAQYTGLGPEYLLVGHGADELIDLVMRLLIEPGDIIVNCPPTFGMYAFDADINGARIIDVWRDDAFAVDIESIEALFTRAAPAAPKLIFVTSPNNPDGSILPDATLKRLLALPAIVVLDEAYVEFSGGSRITWVAEHSNLIVLRTFSKWAGLAGLRVGYGAVPLPIIEQLWKIKQPYNVNLAGQIAAEVSLDDCDYLMKNVNNLVEQREAFYPLLNDIDWLTPYPSQANFILCRVHGRPAAVVKEQLAERGVLVRYYNSTRLSDHIRISIGTPAQMSTLATHLRSL